MTEVITRNAADIQEMFKAPNRQDDLLLNQEERIFLFEQLIAKDRIPTGLDVQHLAYQGDWYNQGQEPTCLPWAYVNAALRVGLSPLPATTAKLVNMANGIGMMGIKGMHIFALEQTVKDFNIRPVITRLYGENGIKSFAAIDTELVKNLCEEGNVLVTMNLYSVIKSYQMEQTIQRNARAVTKAITERSVILTSVKASGFRGEIEDDTNHAICIAGYSVDSNSFMDLQVMDSARGIFWITLEHLTESIRQHSTWLVTPEPLILAR